MRPREIRPEDLAGLPAAQYVRDSTADQAEGYGPDIQRRQNLGFIERYGLLDTSLVYEEYVSGGSVERRAEIHHALADMRAGRYRVLLVAWSHRFARSIKDAEWLKEQIAELGGILVYTGQGIISGQRATRISERVHHILDEEYRANLSDVMTEALAEKFHAGGANGAPPLGAKHLYLRRDGSIAQGPERQTNAIRALNEAELPILRAVLTRYAQTGSYRKTADWLTEHGYRTRAGRPFTFDSVKEIIRNPYYGSEEIVRYHPGQADEIERRTSPERRIFPDDIHRLWEQCQEQREHWAKRSAPSVADHIYPLHAVMRCATCGSQYHGHTSKSGRRSRHVAEPAGCQRPRAPQSRLLEDHLIEGLQSAKLPRAWRSMIRHILAEPPKEDRTKERERIERQIERLRYQHQIGVIDDETLRREHTELRGRLREFEDERPQTIEAYREPAQLLRSVGAILGHPYLREREDGMQWFQRFCQTAFERIDVAGDTVTTIHPRPRYRELFAVALAGDGVWNGAAEGLSPQTSYVSALEASRSAISVAGLDSILETLRAAS